MTRHLNLPALLACIGLTACGSAGDISQRNPNYFGASLKSGVMTGTYNPAGFTGEVVQNQLKSMCVGERIGSFKQGRTSDGLMAFEARCASGATMSRAFIEVERMPNGNFSVEVLGS